MVGDDEFDFSEPGLADVFNEKNLVLVYRFSLEIEKARSMFDWHNNGTNDCCKKPGNEEGEGNNMTERNETVKTTEFPKEQGCERHMCCNLYDTFLSSYSFLNPGYF